MLPRNKFSVLALIWLAAGIYALVFIESSGSAPPIRHFDKIAHCGLFFVQLWLLAKAYLHQQRQPPYAMLSAFALIYALGSEWAQATFTLSREGSWGDVAADILGALLALTLARRAFINRQPPDYVE